MNVDDNFFNPSAVTLRREGSGATVTWTWRGANLHNVVFDNAGPASATQQSGSFAATFSASGTFTYICTIHGRSVMSGTVVVQ
ncbi:MAG: cupredoxin domain-containing protein [Vicinamibacterales bacterium]